MRSRSSSTSSVHPTMAPYLRNSISTTPVHMDPDQELLLVAQRYQQDRERMTMMAMMAMSLEHLHLQPLGRLICTTQMPNRNGAVSKVVRIGVGLQAPDTTRRLADSPTTTGVSSSIPALYGGHSRTHSNASDFAQHRYECSLSRR
jgi:hypothetical protein